MGKAYDLVVIGTGTAASVAAAAIKATLANNVSANLLFMSHPSPRNALPGEASGAPSTTKTVRG